ncbi:MAG TPA: hypothetical protein VGE29_09580 [Prosthecobacter sp.]
MNNASLGTLIVGIIGMALASCAAPQPKRVLISEGYNRSSEERQQLMIQVEKGDATAGEILSNYYLLVEGDAREGIRWLRKACECDPQNLRLKNNLKVLEEEEEEDLD